MANDSRATRRKGAKEQAQAQAKRTLEEQKESKGIKWGPVLVFAPIILFFLVGAVITAYDWYSGTASSSGGGYYWYVYFC